MANNLPKGKKVDWDKVKQAAENIRNEKNNLQEQIMEILSNNYGKVTLPRKYTRTWYRRKKATEAILQAFRDVVPPEIKVDKNSNCVIGWNACRTEILEELGGGNSEG